MSITPNTKLCAGVGHPMKKSLGVLMHNALFAKEGIDALYFSAEKESIKEFVDVIRKLPLHFCAVTAPHKQTVMRHLDRVDADARKIGAVNTIINRNGKLTGYNTDLAGIEASLSHTPLRGKSVLILGAGGAAQPLALHLNRKNAEVFCFNRDARKAKMLCKKFGGKAITSAELPYLRFDIVVNATSLGMAHQPDTTPLDAKYFRKGMTVFDFVYNPLETRFLREARARGAKTIGGLTMYVAQALEQERLWHGRRFSDRGYTGLLKKALLKA